MEAYCVKCRTKRVLVDAQPTFTASGSPGTRGRCAECGTAVFRMGATPAHEDLPRPEATRRPGRTRRGARRPARAAAARPNMDLKVSRKAPNLVIVESPAKARTLERYLGPDHRVKASVGHVRDLLKSRLSVDVDSEFEPTYRVPNEKRRIVNELRAAVQRSRRIYLATDPDREGEAIAWHIAVATDAPQDRIGRVVFHEVTESAVRKAFLSPRDINMHLVDAQQARRVLDRLVGYTISPLLWSKVRGRLSAGRVQSVALRLVVEREREIQAFVPEEYWTLDAELAKRDQPPARLTFMARLLKVRGKKADLRREPDAAEIVAALEDAAYSVSDIERRERLRRPAAPFTTSTLQQDASRRLQFGARKTMRVAQDLYEGIELGPEGAQGLITYMRTDSTNVAGQAQTQARSFIEQRYGKDYLPSRAPIYRSKSKGAQEAHEAIRPTSIFRQPDQIKAYLSRDQYRLYDLIWRRFVASQMASAVYDTTRVDIMAGDPATSVDKRPYLFRASGLVVKFPGFMAVYSLSSEEERELPPLELREDLELVRLVPLQHFTQPPPRYSEASLVKALEEHGIGRPSTYAPTLSTIEQRGYVEQIERRLHPTELGIIVTDLLVEHFPDIFDVGFTAHMENELDDIAAGRREWVPVLREFWRPFEEDLKKAESAMERVMLEPEQTGQSCPDCGRPLVIRVGRYGKFIGCSGFPECRHTEPLVERIGVDCPRCGRELVERRTRKGRVFYGCIGYPECEWSSWRKPTSLRCPDCEGVIVQQGRAGGQCIECGRRIGLKHLKAEPAGRPVGPTPA